MDKEYSYKALNKHKLYVSVVLWALRKISHGTQILFRHNAECWTDS